MKFAVTRQHYYYSGEMLVEVTSGGFDYAGADCLMPKYPGEGHEFDDPVEAVHAATQIRKAWCRAVKEPRGLAVGTTGGMGLELEPCTIQEALAWAKKHAARIEMERDEEEYDGAEDWDSDVQDDR